MKTVAFELLQTWCDSLLKLQINGTGQSALDGALLCPACHTIHGRCGELVYPLLMLAKHTGKENYLTAAQKLFDWSESLLCSDGSMYNDGQSAWNGITAFAAVSLCDALRLHGDLLSSQTRARWKARLRLHGDWIINHIDENFNSNINYNAAAAGALALLGRYFSDETYMAHAHRMAGYVCRRVGRDGLFYGEGKPIDHLTPRGCRPFDIGYNVEESLPLMLLYAEQSGNTSVWTWAADALKAHLPFMLPDGGWDNSFGTRNYKWTYWGSRTSEGCAEAYALLGQNDPACASAAARNLAQMRRCTHEGLLCGGPDYFKVGAKPCVHHSFSHARPLAALVDRGLDPKPGSALPIEGAPVLSHYPTIDTWRIHLGGWVADITGYDFSYMPGGHTSGGALSLLWHSCCGLMVASSMTDYRLFEAHNMQQLTDKALQGSLTPRLEMQQGNGRYASCYDIEARINAEQTDQSVDVWTNGTLCTIEQSPLPDGGEYHLRYHFTPRALQITATTEADIPIDFVLPVAHAQIEPDAAEIRRVFCLAGGLLANEYRWKLHPHVPLTITIKPQ